MTRLIMIGLALAMLGGCSNKAEDLKSPCVSGENSPCDRRAPANQA